MKRSTCSAVARQRRGKSSIAARACFCLTVLLVLAAVSASAQSTAVPPTTAFQSLGVSPSTPAPSNPPTAPVGGIILYGNKLVNGVQTPVRHLWAGDSNFGICRIDPDIDTGNAQIAAALAANPLVTPPSPFFFNINTCPFKLNGLSVTGGPMAFDPKTSNLYLTDEQTNSEGIFRIGFDPTGDSGDGALNFDSIFAMAGSITGSRFSGGTTGCSFPNDTTATPILPIGRPNGAALAPDGNLWVAFKKTGAMLRINSPATATSSGFGTCNDFIQLVAATPSRGGGNGIAFIGHDLWGADATGPFVITNADTTCQALLTGTTAQTPTCTGTNPANATFAALTPTAVYGDQTYPYMNGNNLYFGSATDDMWVGNISGGGTIVVNPFEPAGAFVFNGNPTININGVTADFTDPANVVFYSGDDPSGAALLGQGRWWQVAQNPSAPAAPNAPTVVRASAAGSTVTLGWSPSQDAQTVLFYTVHASTVPVGVVLADITVAPTGAQMFAPNFLVIPGLADGVYVFQVTANNGSGPGAPATSNSVTLPQLTTPGIPTNVVATAGDSTAFISFVAPPNAAAQTITGYQITSTPATVPLIVPAGTTSTPFTGLLNGTTYTFTVHAINGTVNGMESTPSNPVTPQPAPNATLTLTGPAVVTSIPIMSTFTATLKNPTSTAINAATLTYALTTTDGATILVGQPGQGTCPAGGPGVINMTCTIGTIAPGASINVSFIVQIVSADITGAASSNVTAPGTLPVTLTTVTPGAPPQGGNGPTVVIPVTAISAKPQMNKATSTTHTFTATNTTSTVVTGVSFTITEPALFTITSVTPSANPTGLGVLTCAAPVAGVANGIAVKNIVCTIPSLGGNLKGGAKLTAPQTITVVVGVTAPNSASTSSVSAALAFNGIDGVSPTASFTQIVK